MNRRLPRMRLVALRTARAAPRAVSFSVRYDPTTRCPLPSPCTASETMITVESKARTALTPRSSKLIPPCTACPRATTHACAAQRSSPACEASPSPSPVNCSESRQVKPTRARQRPLGNRSRVNSANRSRSGSGVVVDIGVAGWQSPCHLAQAGDEQRDQVVIRNAVSLGEQRGLG
jgi:hypothetical protein